jgi:N-methylhydantoinase A
VTITARITNTAGSRYRLGVDIGGTFTDIVLVSPNGQIYSKKVSSTDDDYARGILEGIEKVLVAFDLSDINITEVTHGTTVASNTILQMSGPRTGLITTLGFRDVLELRTLRMPRLYDLRWEKPPPLVERYLRVEVDERVDTQGQVQKTLDRVSAECAVNRLLEEGVEAIAVCLINSFANPINERLLSDVIQETAPEVPCCISYDVLPEIKEYERTSTTVINAYLLPVIMGYLNSLVFRLQDAGIGAPLLLMQSNGGLTSVEQACRLPCHIIESGPAGGVVGAHAVSKHVGLDDVVTFDMGGTTAKASLIERGQYSRAVEYSVGGGIMIASRLLTGSGYRLKVPAIDLAEVGAGGGSIVWLDPAGSLKIGPRSAGASPGPVCYGTGGMEPTVTDVCVILGYLNPNHLIGGELRINAELSRKVFTEQIADPMGLDVYHAAYGAFEIACANMIRAIKSVSSERGRDPRSYVLFAFGGNGPLFAASMARVLGMSRILVPQIPGLFSAFGLLCADVEHHYSRTFCRVLQETDPLELEVGWESLEQQALDQLAKNGFEASQTRLQRSASMHYQGQIYELSVPVPEGLIDQNLIDTLEMAFGDEHERTYGHRAGPEEPVELVNLELIGQGISKQSRVPGTLHVGKTSQRDSLARQVYFGPDRGWMEVPVFDRGWLNDATDGPCIVEEYDATCLVPPNARASLDERGNIVIDLQIMGSK